MQESEKFACATDRQQLNQSYEKDRSLLCVLLRAVRSVNRA